MGTQPRLAAVEVATETYVSGECSERRTQALTLERPRVLCAGVPGWRNW